MQLDYNGFGRLSDIRNTDTQNSTFDNISNDIAGLEHSEPIQIDQQLRAFYAPNDKDVYSLEASYQYQLQDPWYNLINSGQPFASIIPLRGSVLMILHRLRETETERQEALFLLPHFEQDQPYQFQKVGNIYSSQRLTSNLFETLSDESSIDITNAELTNLVDYTFRELLCRSSMEK